MRRFPAGNHSSSFLMRLPFWFSTSNYYILTAALSIAAFFLIWAILGEENGEISWITAGVAAVLVVIGAVVFRNAMMKRVHQSFAPDRLSFNLRNLRERQSETDSNKLTIEKNARILEAIERKSKAAQVLSKLPEGHLEVFELCEVYLKKNEDELEHAGVGSPRLPVLRRSREKVVKLHKYHLLSWASLESGLLIQDAKVQTKISEKIENSQRALSVLDSAAQFYPDETLLTDSISAVKEFITTVKVEELMEQAERAAFRRHYKKAINHYRDALYFLTEENNSPPGNDPVVSKINAEIERLSTIKKKD